MKTENQNVDIHFGQTKEADLKTFDLGVNVGLRVDYSRYFFSVSALCGTLDRRAIEREGESSLYQNNVTLSLGYMFGKYLLLRHTENEMILSLSFRRRKDIFLDVKY